MNYIKFKKFLSRTNKTCYIIIYHKKRKRFFVKLGNHMLISKDGITYFDRNNTCLEHFRARTILIKFNPSCEFIKLPIDEYWDAIITANKPFAKKCIKILSRKLIQNLYKDYQKSNNEYDNHLLKLEQIQCQEYLNNIK